MKTLKEKAKELIWEYLPILEGWTSNEKTNLAKKCALICVEEKIKFLNKMCGYWHITDGEWYADEQKKLNELKQEIGKL